MGGVGFWRKSLRTKQINIYIHIYIYIYTYKSITVKWWDNPRLAEQAVDKNIIKILCSILKSPIVFSPGHDATRGDGAQSHAYWTPVVASGSPATLPSWSTASGLCPFWCGTKQKKSFHMMGFFNGELRWSKEEGGVYRFLIRRNCKYADVMKICYDF